MAHSSAPPPEGARRPRFGLGADGTSSPLMLLVKIAGLAVVAAIAVWAAMPLIRTDNWWGMAVLVAVTALAFYVYLSPRPVPLKYLLPGEKGPKTPAFQVTFQGGARLVLTEAGSKKRAGVWLLTPEQVEAELEHLGPEALGIGADALADICASESRRMHALLRNQHVIAGIGRAWANEILHHARLSPYALSKDLSREDVERLAQSIDIELERGLELRERGANDVKTYRVHRKLGVDNRAAAAARAHEVWATRPIPPE